MCNFLKANKMLLNVKANSILDVYEMMDNMIMQQNMLLFFWLL